MEGRQHSAAAPSASGAASSGGGRMAVQRAVLHEILLQRLSGPLNVLRIGATGAALAVDEADAPVPVAP
eukprot:1153597-Lingulodinium_polyedra.AAC.1